jgi:hypothetical protein
LNQFSIPASIDLSTRPSRHRQIPPSLEWTRFTFSLRQPIECEDSLSRCSGASSHLCSQSLNSLKDP